MSRVSIGLPVYNGARYLARAIESLLAQDFDDFELILSDNASTDGTEAICRRYADSDRRVRYSRNPVNVGAAPNFNLAFSLSRSPYFAWAAYDDSWAPGFLRQCVAALDARPDAVIAHPWVRVEDFDGHAFAEQPGEFLDETADVVERFRACVHDHWAPLAVYGLIRSSALQKTQMFKSFMGSDKVLLAELSLLGPFIQVPGVLWTYRTAGFAQGAPYVARVRKDLGLNRNLLATAMPWVLLESEYLRVASSAHLPVSAKLRLISTALRWYAVDSLMLPRVRAVALAALGTQRFDGVRNGLRAMPWYRRFRRIGEG